MGMEKESNPSPRRRLPLGVLLLSACLIKCCLKHSLKSSLKCSFKDMASEDGQLFAKANLLLQPLRPLPGIAVEVWKEIRRMSLDQDKPNSELHN